MQINFKSFIFVFEMHPGVTVASASCQWAGSWVGDLGQ